MGNPRRKQRYRKARQLASKPGPKPETPASNHWSWNPAASPSYTDCHPLDWVPDFDNAHLQSAAAGRLSIGDPFHHAPAPIDFDPPGVRRTRC